MYPVSHLSAAVFPHLPLLQVREREERGGWGESGGSMIVSEDQARREEVEEEKQRVREEKYIAWSVRVGKSPDYEVMK